MIFLRDWLAGFFFPCSLSPDFKSLPNFTMQEDIADPTKLGATASSRSERIKSAAADKIREGKERARQMHGSAEDYVRDHPTKCVLSAFGVGVAIGLIIRR